MLSPLDFIKGYFTLKSYFSWFIIALILFHLYAFFKNKTNPLTWTSYVKSFSLLLFLLGVIYLFFFYKPERLSKYAAEATTKVGEAIAKYEETIHNYQGLKKDWEAELQACEATLKALLAQQALTQ
ncbi:MAG: DNA double-strand break repair protein Rad50, partial [Vigna little leaf phytoplasma]|nr:DNA double-strand break repair protein Rad50 [Vigna little leaf phytoplasma]